MEAINDGWQIAAILVGLGVMLSGVAWFAADRFPRVGFALWCVGATGFGLGLFGLSEALCSGGACQ